MSFAVLTALFSVTAVYIGYFYDGPRPVIYATFVKATCSMACYFTAGAMFKLIGPRMAFRLQYAVIIAAIYIGMSYADDGMLRFPVAIASAFAFAYIVIAISPWPKWAPTATFPTAYTCTPSQFSRRLPSIFPTRVA